MDGGGESGLYNSSIAKGFSVLEAFDKGRPSLSLTQLVAATGLEKSAAQRFTATLVRLGYLRKDPVSRYYSLSPRLLHLGAGYLRTSPLVGRAMPYLLEWNKQHNETINIGEMDGFDVIVTDRFRTREVVSADVMIGSKFPWSVTSVGQAIAAFLPDAEQETLIARSQLVRYAASSITRRDLLTKRLRTVRREGFAFCVGESYDEDISIAAPVFDATGRPVAAVATAVLTTKWTLTDARKKLAPSVRELAKAISSSSQMARSRRAPE